MVTGPAGSTGLLNANARNYQVAWRQVQFPDPVCQPSCAVTVNFTMTLQPE